MNMTSNLFRAPSDINHDKAIAILYSCMGAPSGNPMLEPVGAHLERLPISAEEQTHVRDLISRIESGKIDKLEEAEANSLILEMKEYARRTAVWGVELSANDFTLKYILGLLKYFHINTKHFKENYPRNGYYIALRCSAWTERDHDSGCIKHLFIVDQRVSNDLDCSKIHRTSIHEKDMIETLASFIGVGVPLLDLLGNNMLEDPAVTVFDEIINAEVLATKHEKKEG